MSRDAIAHLRIERLGGGEKPYPGRRRAGARRTSRCAACTLRELNRVPTLAAPGAAENEMGLGPYRHPDLPRRPVRSAGVRAGLLALGSSYSPRLPGSPEPVALSW